MAKITYHDGGDLWDVVKASVDAEFQHLAIVQDVHVGHPAFRKKAFEKFVAYITEKEALWIYNGDGPENATRFSVGDSNEQLMTVNEQMKYLYGILEPIKDRCIGYNTGNHDERTKKQSDFDFSAELADRLGIRYSGYESFSIISNRDERDGGTAYSVYSCHSGSGHKNAGLALNVMESNWSWMENIDIKVKGHDHQVGVIPSASLRLDFANKCVRERIVWLACPGSFLGRAKTYAGKKPYKPAPPIYYSMLLDMRKGKKKVLPIQHELD